MIEIYLYSLVFLVGITIGSFLNTIIYRIPISLGITVHQETISIYKPRSFCPNCKEMIPFYFNIPLLSFILLKGRCSFCNNKISFSYPLIELINSIFYLSLYYIYGLSSEFIFYSLAISLLIPISIIDTKFKIIPNSLSYSLLGIGLVFSIANSHLLFVDSLIAATAGFLVFYLISVMYMFFKNEEGLGIGDAKLLAAISSFVGFQNIPIILLITSIVGICLGLIFYINKKNKTGFLKSSIPLAPSMMVSFVFILFIS